MNSTRPLWQKLQLHFFLAIIIIAEIHAIYPYHETADIPVQDEAAYMGRGWGWLVHGRKLALADSPLYSILYGVLVQLTSTVASISMMRYLLTTAVTASFFLLVHKVSKNPWIALAIACVWCIASANVQAFLMVNHLGLLCFTCVLILVERHPVLALLCAALAALSRLDYVIAFGVVLVVVFIRATRTNRSAWSDALRRRGVLVAGGGLTAVGLFAAVSIGDWNVGSSRMWVAFCQHFALRYSQTGRFQGNPWDECGRLLAEKFPHADGLVSALLSNPTDLLPHVQHNLGMMSEIMIHMFLPSRSFELHAVVPLVIGLSSAAALGAAVARGELVSCFRRARGTLRRHKWQFLVACAGIPTLIPSVAVWYYGQYLLPVVPIFVLLVTILLSSLGMDLAGTVGFSWIVVAFSVLTHGSSPYASPQPRPTLAKVQAIQQLAEGHSLRIVGCHSRSFADYLPDGNVQTINLHTGSFQGRFGVQDIINAYRPQAVLVNVDLLSYSTFDQSTLELLKQPGWVSFRLEDETLYVSKDWLDANRRGSVQGQTPGSP